MLNKILVNSKISLIKNYIKEIEGIIFNLGIKEILADYTKLRTLERNFQLVVDEMIDINLYLIKENELAVPSDFQGSFEVLSEAKILPLDFAIRVAPVVGLRNRLVHRYEEIDRKFFIEQVKKDHKDFIKYIKLITDYINKQ